MNLVFYYSPMSSSNRIHWALEELGVPYEKVKVDLAAGAQKKPEYLALNPNGKVPLLVVDGHPIFESLAILIFLGEQFGTEKDLFPQPGLERAEALKWMAWGSVSLTETLFRYVRNTSERFPAEEKNEKAAASAKAELSVYLTTLDKALEGKDYLLGSNFSLTDVSLASLFAFMARVGIDTNPYKNINAWVGRCMSRPALARVMMG